MAFPNKGAIKRQQEAASGDQRATPGTPRIVVTGMGHFFPETVLDNPFFESLDIGSAAQWIEERVGIRERRSVLSRDEVLKLRRGEVTRAELKAAGRIMTMAAMCQEPWSQALNRRNAKHQNDSSNASLQINQVIAGTSVPDWDIPANACAIANGLGLECAAFDCNSACSTFVVNLHVARALMRSGVVKTTAIFNAERYTTRIDFSDRSTCVLFGDSAAAALLETEDGHSEKLKGLELVDTFIESTPSGSDHVRLPDGGVFSQNGAAVQKFATTKTIASAQEILHRNGLETADITYFIAHQANLRMLSYAAEKLGLRPEQHLYNVDKCGNQGASGAPTVLSSHWDRYKVGDTIVMSVVGSGLTWGAALFRCV